MEKNKKSVAISTEKKEIKKLSDVKSKYTQFIDEIDKMKSEGLAVKDIRKKLDEKYPEFLSENIMKRYRKFKRQIKRGQLEDK